MALFSSLNEPLANRYWQQTAGMPRLQVLFKLHRQFDAYRVAVHVKDMLDRVNNRLKYTPDFRKLLTVIQQVYSFDPFLHHDIMARLLAARNPTAVVDIHNPLKGPAITADEPLVHYAFNFDVPKRVTIAYAVERLLQL